MRKAIAGIVMSFWAFPAFAEGVVIAALGDSLTQGYGLQQADGFVSQLETWLQDQGAEVTLINAGVSGDTTAGGASRVAWTLTPEVDAMIVALGGNDLLRGIDPSVGRANLESILQAAKAADVAVLLVGMQAPGNYGPAYKDAFDAMYPELAAQYGALFQDSFFDGLGGAGLDPAQARPFLQDDGIHPNADGVKKIVEGFGPNVLALIKAAQVADGS